MYKGELTGRGFLFEPPPVARVEATAFLFELVLFEGAQPRRSWASAGGSDQARYQC